MVIVTDNRLIAARKTAKHASIKDVISKHVIGLSVAEFAAKGGVS